MQDERRLLTLRIDRELMHRLRARLGAENRTMSEVIVQGLRHYVEHSEPAEQAAGQVLTDPEALTLPGQVTSYLCELRAEGQSAILSATLAALHEAGWPLRPLADALGISRQAVQARTRQPVSAEVRAQVPPCAPPPAFPRRRAGSPGRARRPFTVKVDRALRAAAHRKASQEGKSLTQVVHRILDRYLKHEASEILLGDTTPTRPKRGRRESQ